MTDTKARPPVTRELAAYAVASRYDALPDTVRRQVRRAFLNWLGCALGGSREDVVQRATAAARAVGAAPQALIFGTRHRVDTGNAAYLNSLAASALSFDDTHLATVCHPTSPVAAALLAYGETASLSGEGFLNALALGVEVQCRLSNALLLPPAKANLSLYITGITAPIGVAVALGRAMRLDERKMQSAIGLAAAQAAGFRATHGSMAGVMVPAFGARSGVFAAMLAQQGVHCTSDALEGRNGFFDVFAPDGRPDLATERLGVQFELLAVAYKPYPCGIVIHPAIDACLEIAAQLPPGIRVKTVRLDVHPLALALANRRHPETAFEAQVSLFHWASVALLRLSTGAEVLAQSTIDNASVAAMRVRIDAVPRPEFAREEAAAEVLLENGQSYRAHVRVARGSAARPMTDSELKEKFGAQAAKVLSPPGVEQMLMLAEGIAEQEDVSRTVVDLHRAFRRPTR